MSWVPCDDRLNPVGGRVKRGLFSLFLTAAATLAGAELKPETAEAFDRYAARNEERIESEFARGVSLWIDREPPSKRQQLLAQLRQDQVLLQDLKPADIDISGGTLHHWVGVALAPGITLEQAAAVAAEYQNYQKIHQPYITRSVVLERKGRDARIQLRLFRKKVITAVFETEHEVRSTRLDAHRVFTRTRATRIEEVEHAGRPDERLRPEGDNRGLLWRHRSYWVFVETPEGTYLEQEALALSRELPSVISWAIGSFLRSVHRDFVEDMVRNTRQALLAQPSGLQR
jgi:hypothetical protein